MWMVSKLDTTTKQKIRWAWYQKNFLRVFFSRKKNFPSGIFQPGSKWGKKMALQVQWPWKSRRKATRNEEKEEISEYIFPNRIPCGDIFITNPSNSCTSHFLRLFDFFAFVTCNKTPNLWNDDEREAKVKEEGIFQMFSFVSFLFRV